MTHPDPRTAEVVERNQRAYSEAVDAPPPHIADDPAAFFRWKRDTPRDTTTRPRPRRFVDYRRPDRTTTPPVRPHEPDPAYQAAAQLLMRLPDLGQAAITRARQQLGDDTPYQHLIIRAAAITRNRTP